MKMESQSLSTQEKKSVDFSKDIIGWGADLDPSVRPGVPRDKAPYIGVETLYPKDIEQQIPHIKIHQSTEHQKLTPVFGTSCPPSGISGAIRNFAYTYSEGRMTHWLLLLFADRVNVIEDLALDLSKGRLPNLWREMGLSSELKYNKKNFIKNIMLASVGIIGIFALVRSSRRVITKAQNGYELA
jgi:hypothetical protein